MIWDYVKETLEAHDNNFTETVIEFAHMLSCDLITRAEFGNMTYMLHQMHKDAI